jgi:UDP-arabinose 4-epimerase
MKAAPSRSTDEPMKTILVTGGAGYIGSHACKALAAAGYRPVAYDNLIYGHEWAVKWGPLEVGDIQDSERLDEVFERYRPFAVMHFAAFSFVGESVADPARYYRNNVVGTLNLLEAMRRHGLDRLVFSSTCATYGAPERMPVTEDAPQRPLNPYGSSKLMVEQILNDYGQAFGLRAIALRYFNAAGADPQGEIGDEQHPKLRLLPLVLEAAAGALPHLTVFGEDYDTPDGTCIRDYIHVSDLAEAHVLALASLEDGEGLRAYNLGTGQGFSVAQIIEVSERITGCAIPVAMGARRPGDPPVVFADASRARSELGWEPRFSNLDIIVETAWRWRNRNTLPPLGRESVAALGDA